MTEGQVFLAKGDEHSLASELREAVLAAGAELGIPLRSARPGELGPARTDRLVLGIGFPAYYPELSGPPGAIPRVSWLGEPLPPPRPARPDDVLFRRLPSGRLTDVAIRAATIGRRGAAPATLVRWRERAAFERERQRNLRALAGAARRGIRLVVTNRGDAASLERARVRADVVPFGFHEAMAGPPTDPGSDRDIDVLVLGSSVDDPMTRRARVLGEVVAAIYRHASVAVVDRDAYGPARHELLRRSRIVLNVQRVPGGYSGIRHILAAAAGAVMVSEPVDDPHPFVPGLDYLQVESRRLPETVLELLADESRRREIADSAQAFVVNELTMARSLEWLLRAVG